MTNINNIYAHGAINTKPDKPIYIHRGNPKYLNLIIDSIKNKESIDKDVQK